ncbi:RNA-guided endonuclease InsQ/TnpB family protein [Oxynema aestuarii]|uniref:IS200/IS605 family element transposase accessory protein TnpB n=1 Tax=Oxynema aestuarii AP17 TaxID=2064643 RepID=A0A6H1U0A1_9CYAN|nr:RNA-guided endonuclease TnpB family protein [Oxynema aestuarii]QIZ71590.1 IS200/IS605 family element transposase accessory protein TnpB [Oxynema aestuarii AP17]
MLKAVKVRLYPNKQQKQSLEQSFGNCRWLWNYGLNLMNQTYKETGKGLSSYDIKKQIPSLKQEYEWLKLTYSQCLQQVCTNLGTAFNNFFEKRARYPRFKSKHGKQSIQYPQNVKVLENALKLPKIGEVKAVVHRPIEGKLKTVTVTKNRCDQYFASILFEDGKPNPDSSTEGKAVGVDLGLNHFAVTSDGSKFDNPRWIAKHERNLKRKQQDLSRKQKGSNNRNKARKKVAKVHNKVACCREDFLHKLSRRIVDENQVICVENLNVKGMLKNPNLAEAIGQVGWEMFLTMLKYKAEQEGKVYIEVDRFFPSSKTCNVCLNQIDRLSLDVRNWTCSHCGTSHDRDLNAAINLREEGLRLLTCGTRGQAYCRDVRPNRRGRKKSTIGQSVG